MTDNLKTWPERIYIQHTDDDEPMPFSEASRNQDEVTWCDVRQFKADVEYVRADLAAKELTTNSVVGQKAANVDDKDLRAAFESHFGLTARQAWQHPDGSYKFPEIQAKWEGYLAGVAATPKRSPSMAVDRQFSNLLANYLDAVEFAEADPEALKQAGISRKALTDYLDGLLVAPVAAAAPGAGDAKECPVCKTSSGDHSEDCLMR